MMKLVTYTTGSFSRVLAYSAIVVHMVIIHYTIIVMTA